MIAVPFCRGCSPLPSRINKIDSRRRRRKEGRKRRRVEKKICIIGRIEREREREERDGAGWSGLGGQ